jgi:putative alpha-1,2-mannosidase
MYPVIPGTDVLVIHGPQFPSAKVHLVTGKTLTIEGEGAGNGAIYVQGLDVDGTATTKSWLRYADLAQGAVLHFMMGSSASATWGVGDADRPPSFAP